MRWGLWSTFEIYVVENSRFGVWVWDPRRLLRGLQFHPPLSEDSRMGRRRRAFLSDTGAHGASQTYRRTSRRLRLRRSARSRYLKL